MFKVNSRKTRARCEICSKLTIKTPERHQWCCSGVFIVNFEYISYLFRVFIPNIKQVNAGWDNSLCTLTSREYKDTFQLMNIIMHHFINLKKKVELISPAHFSLASVSPFRFQALSNPLELFRIISPAGSLIFPNLLFRVGKG